MGLTPTASFLFMGLGQHAVLPLPARGARVIRGYRFPSTQHSMQPSVLRAPPCQLARSPRAYFFPAFGLALARLI